MSTVRGAAARRVRGGRHAGRGGAPTTQQVLRRRRADEALARSYEALRREVLAGVRARLARRGVVLPDADLDAFSTRRGRASTTSSSPAGRCATPPASSS